MRKVRAITLHVGDVCNVVISNRPYQLTVSQVDKDLNKVHGHITDRAMVNISDFAIHGDYLVDIPDESEGATSVSCPYCGHGLSITVTIDGGKS